MRSEAAVLYLCFAFVSGVFLASFFFISQQALPAFFILGIILICTFWKRNQFAVAGFCLVFFAFGLWRVQAAELGIENKVMAQYYDEKVTLVGRLAKEPDMREGNMKITLAVESVRADGEDAQYISVDAKVLITVNPYPAYNYGDRLEARGRLQMPADSEDFNYRKYLSAQGIAFIMYWPEVDLLPQGKRSLALIAYGKILEGKKKFREGLEQNLSPPQSTILGAIIFGDQGSGRVSKEWADKLNKSGLRHITAISGMNITIIAQMLFALGLAIGLWRGQAFYFALLILSIYILIVGAPASAVRAGIMGGLFLLAQKVGRPANAGRAIVFAAAGMVALNPLLLTRDAGFQLSFLAMIGMVYMVPSLQRWLNFIPDPRWLPVRSLCAMTLAAQFFTLPLLIYNFGQLSLAAPLANVLIVPFLPLITILGFAYSAISMVWQPLGWIFSWPTWLLMTYIIKIIDIFSVLPLAYWSVKNASWLLLLVVYAPLAYFVYKLQRKERLQFLQ